MKPLSILVADDVPEIQAIVSQWLKHRGHRVECASTGDEALKLLKNEHFDLIILDVLMPDGDGLDVITEIQKTGRTERILAISGGGKYMPAADCVKLANGLGSHAAVLKPFDERQLMAGIERALGIADPAAA